MHQLTTLASWKEEIWWFSSEDKFKHCRAIFLVLVQLGGRSYNSDWFQQVFWTMRDMTQDGNDQELLEEMFIIIDEVVQSLTENLKLKQKPEIIREIDTIDRIDIIPARIVDRQDWEITINLIDDVWSVGTFKTTGEVNISEPGFIFINDIHTTDNRRNVQVHNANDHEELFKDEGENPFTILKE